MLAFGSQFTRGLSPVSTVYLMAFELQPPPNWCQAHKSGGPGVLAIAVEIARGLSPVSAGYLLAFECHSCLDPFGDVWSDALRAWRLGEKPSSGVPSPPRGYLGLTQRRKDAKTDGEMRDCPRGFCSLHFTLHTSHFTLHTSHFTLHRWAVRLALHQRSRLLAGSFFEGWIDDCRVMIVDF